MQEISHYLSLRIYVKLPVLLFGTKSKGFFGRERGQYHTQGISKTFPRTSSNRVLKKLSNKAGLRLDEKKRCFFYIWLFPWLSKLSRVTNVTQCSYCLYHCSSKKFDISFRASKSKQIYFILQLTKQPTQYIEMYNGRPACIINNILGYFECFWKKSSSKMQTNRKESMWPFYTSVCVLWKRPRKNGCN